MSDKLEQLEEGLLVLRAQSGDSMAFRQLVDRYDRRLLYFIRRLLDDSEEAFDVLQGIWLNVYRQLPRLQVPEAFRVWLYRIAHDQAVTALRKRHPTVSLDNCPAEPTCDPIDTIVQYESVTELHRALQALSVDHRRVVTLRFLEDMSIEDIAEVLQCPPGTVKSRLHYAKLLLRQHLSENSHA